MQAKEGNRVKRKKAIQRGDMIRVSLESGDVVTVELIGMNQRPARLKVTAPGGSVVNTCQLPNNST